ncbi:hypothetical protein PARC_a1092 [Pseudoalteromonas arctica A 37-1-2]|uniref:Uncharacterized protein n=1 Tax=Pseudoalteromonas arctica A 37-1-2 TaxID=1117313 RepID=A0A290S2J7_9GAMM|nr:hypothetical protein PARC_a1092 [Pseudoalteromonas arctica A 37-1-2]
MISTSTITSDSTIESISPVGVATSAFEKTELVKAINKLIVVF